MTIAVFPHVSIHIFVKRHFEGYRYLVTVCYLGYRPYRCLYLPIKAAENVDPFLLSSY